MTRIETARLILRRPVAGDLPAYEAYCTSDRTRFTGGPYSRQAAFEKLAAMIGHWEIRGFGRLILCDRFTARPIGHVGALQLDPNTPVEMTWTLWADADEGLGLAHEAARAYLDEVAAKGVFQSLFARVDANNRRSRTLALRLGAVEDTGATAPDWMPEALTYRFDFKS
jgi:RimJ/RimL family protein N-acetyltransferase